MAAGVFTTAATRSSYYVKKVGHSVLALFSLSNKVNLIHFPHNNLTQLCDGEITFVQCIVYGEGDEKPAKGLL